jgi:hypothetical protein
MPGYGERFVSYRGDRVGFGHTAEPRLPQNPLATAKWPG